MAIYKIKNNYHNIAFYNKNIYSNEKKNILHKFAEKPIENKHSRVTLFMSSSVITNFFYGYYMVTHLLRPLVTKKS